MTIHWQNPERVRAYLERQIDHLQTAYGTNTEWEASLNSTAGRYFELHPQDAAAIEAAYADWLASESWKWE